MRMGNGNGMRWVRAAAAALAAAALAAAVAGCGGDEAGADGGQTAPATRTVTHHMGVTEVPADPRRVVVLDTGELDSAIALGVAPVGAVESLPGEGLLDYLDDRVEGVEIVGTIEEPNLEAIAALRPDLILSSALRHEAIYDRLSAIAPTVFTETVGVVWKDNLMVHAQALGREERARELLAAYEERAAALGARYGDDRPTVSVVRFLPGETRIYLKDTFIGTILQDAGLPRPPAQDVHEFALYPSGEQVGLMDGDVIFHSHYGPAEDTTEAAITGGRLWQRLRAVRAGRVHEVPEGHWMLGIGIGAAQLVLDDLERLLPAP